ncbi:MAG: hypothetical protein JWO05_1037 [Gemmatimonadetes bacterium]|nr:hypothetical protein [Gemmatimonadota bacterium]
MSRYPRNVPESALSPELKALIHELTSRLLSGDSPTHALLREQFAKARIREVELTGVGLFAHFDVPKTTPLASPARMIGGNVPMDVVGLEGGAGCLLCVSDGRLDFLEIYVNGTEEFPERPVVRFGPVIPLGVGSPAGNERTER